MSASSTQLTFLPIASATASSARCCAYPVLCRERVSCSGFPLGLGPSLHRLDGRYPRLRRLLRYYGRVRLLDRSLCGARLVAFPQLLAVHHRRTSAFEVSRLPCRKLSERAELHRLRRERGRHVHSCRRHAMVFRDLRSRRLPQRTRFRSSIARPAHPPSYSSLRRSPHAAQGLGFPGVDSSRGRPCSSRRCLFLSLTYFLLPVLTGDYRTFCDSPQHATPSRSPGLAQNVRRSRAWRTKPNQPEPQQPTSPVQLRSESDPESASGSVSESGIRVRIRVRIRLGRLRPPTPTAAAECSSARCAPGAPTSPRCCVAPGSTRVAACAGVRGRRSIR